MRKLNLTAFKITAAAGLMMLGMSMFACGGAPTDATPGVGYIVQPVDYSQTKPLRNSATGLCLDSNSAGSVYAMDCNGGANQIWYRSGLILVDTATNMYLSTLFPGVVYTDNLVQPNTQNWSWTGSSYRNPLTRQCLDCDPSGKVYTSPCNGDSSQNWW